MRARGTSWIFPLIITILALADGLLHLRLDYALFGGKLWGKPSFGGPPPGAAPAAGAPPMPMPGPPPGGAPPSPLPFVSLPLNELFLLNCIGFIVLAVIFWLVLRALPGWVWAVDGVMILFTLATIVGWIRVGEPNPQGLGYFSKGLEIVLIVALGVHLWSLLAPRRARLRMA